MGKPITHLSDMLVGLCGVGCPFSAPGEVLAMGDGGAAAAFAAFSRLCLAAICPLTGGRLLLLLLVLTGGRKLLQQDMVKHSKRHG